MAKQNNNRGNINKPNNESKHKINSKIWSKEVRLVGDNVEVGIYTISEALSIAGDLELDLVEINPKAEPPICRVIDYDKFIYEQKKADKDQKKSQKRTQQKEIRFGPNTGDGDLEHKMKSAQKFLEDGIKVKVTVFFKGRTIIHKDRGEILLLRFADELSEYGTAESLPKLEGKRMNMLLKPKTKK